MAPRFLVLYGTTDGHTRKIAAAIADTLRTLGDDVEVVNAKRRTPEARPEDFDAVFVAGSLHMGGYQRSLRRWVRAHADALLQKPTAFVSVCLGTLEHREKADRELEDARNRFFAYTGWRPMLTKVVAGALPFTQYGWLKRLVMRRIAAKNMRAVDTRRDYEFTDWNDLKAFTLSVRHRVLAGTPVRRAG